MLLTRTTTDLQRNMGEVAEFCHETRQPVYITKNGAADLVLIDADAFEDIVALRDLAYEREVRTLQGVEQGRREIREGKGRSYSQVRSELDL